MFPLFPVESKKLIVSATILMGVSRFHFHLMFFGGNTGNNPQKIRVSENFNPDDVGGAQSYDNVIPFPQIHDKGPAMIKREGCTGNSPWDYSPSDKVRIGQEIPCNERVDEPGGDT